MYAEEYVTGYWNKVFFSSFFDYIFKSHIVCLMTGMSSFRYVLIFHIFPLSTDYIGLTAFLW